MSPREKWWLAFLSLAAFSLTVCFTPLFLSALVVFGLSCVACFYYTSEWHVHSALGLHPRAHLKVPAGLRRWLPSRDANGLPSRERPNRAASRDSAVASAGERRFGSRVVFHSDAGGSDSPLFSPRDILMGSYLAKADDTSGAGGTRELRERLSQPNDAADTPRRRLSFGETLGTVSKFTTVGVMPPTQQDGVRKSFLTQRNSPAFHSPVTVKISPLDKTQAQVVDHMSPPSTSQSLGLGPSTDSRSPAVPSSLRASRKRDVGRIEDRGSAGGQKSKRRETFGTEARFIITPQRRYPLQQTGSLLVGVMPPTQQDGFRKSFLNQRNSPALHSPVTVKIPRLDKTRPQVFDHLSSPPSSQSLGLGPPADPCSLEAVLSALKQSRKREVDKVDDRASAVGQNSKRSRHESTGSSSSAVEQLLANGAPSQLLPKPATLKRGLNMSVVEESSLKRSRTSSTSSMGSSLTPCGVLGSARNPISSSYSSSLGPPLHKMATSSSPLSSPGSSHLQTPERVCKKPREEEVQSPTSVSTLKPTRTKTDDIPAPGNLTPATKVPVPATSSDSGGSEGTRKRKIQLVSSHRADRISLPPPPELGYTVTVKDLDLEKAAALSRIQKVLEEPEPVKVAPKPVPSFSEPVSSTVQPAPPGLLLGAPAPVAPTAAPASSVAPAPAASVGPTPAGVVHKDPTPVEKNVIPGTVNPLLECLKMMNSPGASLTTSSPTAPTPSTVTTSSVALVLSSDSGPVKSEPSVTTAQPMAQPPSSLATSAFAQVLAQPLPPSASSLPAAGSLTFGLGSSVQLSTTTTVTPNSTSLLTSAFKPIFGKSITTAPSSTTSTPAVPTFKPIFGGSTASPAFRPPVSSDQSPAPSSAPVPAVNGPTLFSTLSGTAVPTAPTNPAPVKSLFGSWSTAPATSSTSTTTSTGSIFQFGGKPATTAALSLSTTTTTATTFQFGSVATTAAATQSSLQGTFTFGQSASKLLTPAAGSFGGFSTAGPSTTAGAPATAGQPVFTFGKPSFNGSAPVAGPALSGAAKPFNFGGASSGSSTFTFGAAASTATATFGTPSNPVFGGGTSTFVFGGTSTPSATPAFGSATQTSAPAPTFAFGGGASSQSTAPVPLQSTPAQPAIGGFNFSPTVSGAQFGTPSSASPATQTPGFSFGAANVQDSKPAFGTSTSAFGQSTPGAPIPFGIPTTPTPSFSGLSPSPFGLSPAAAFSIGSGSKPSGARQRLQARRQHPRKK